MAELLSDDYRVEIDSVDSFAWAETLRRFCDATIYQTWSYGAVRWGEKNLSHLILKKDGNIVACAQLVTIKVPLLQAGIAYMFGGPLWRKVGGEENTGIFRQIIRVVKDEYVESRGMHTRVMTPMHHDSADAVEEIMKQEGFECSPFPKTGRTLLLNIEPPLEDLRAAMQRQWRNNLKKSEMKGLELIQGSDSMLYDHFSDIYRKMHARKKFIEHVSIDEYGRIQSDLPEGLKMHIMVCKSDGHLCSALVSSAIGNVAINLLAASSSYDIENRLNSSYLLFWKMLEWAKMQGCIWYDLGGVNPDQNPGGYQFKKGLAGKTGIDTYGFQRFDSCKSMLSSIMVTCGDYLKTRQNKLKEASFRVSG